MWKIIPNTNNLYECSEEGEVRRVSSLVSNQPKRKTNGFRKVGGKILSPKIKKNGYMELSLHFKPMTPKSCYVHRLVAETWIGSIPHKMTVNHIDGNKTNNKISNLEIVSQSDNMKHAIKNGLAINPIMLGSKNPKATTNEEEVLLIRKIHKETKSIKKLAKIFPHITTSTLANIVYRQCWKHI